MQDTHTRTELDGENLDIRQALGSLDACLNDNSIFGVLGNYRFSLASGRQILLGHIGLPPMPNGGAVECVQSIFMTRGDQFRHSPATWDSVREHIRDGWIFGTVKHPGVKVWITVRGRNWRARPEDILVYR